MESLSRLFVHAGGNGAIEELNWVPPLCHRRQQSTEQTHVAMVVAAADCRLRASLELRRELYERGDRRRSACDAGLRQVAGDQQLSQRRAACRLLRGGDRRRHGRGFWPPPAPFPPQGPPKGRPSRPRAPPPNTPPPTAPPPP